MKKAWYVAIASSALLILFLVSLIWYFFYKDPLSGAFKRLKVGMSEAEVVAVLRRQCPDCDLSQDEYYDNDNKSSNFSWNWESFNDPHETELLFGARTLYADNSYIWFRFEDGALKEARHTHNSYFYLVLPMIMSRNRGFYRVATECLPDNCSKESQSEIIIMTGDEKMLIMENYKNLRRKMLP